MLCVVPLGLGQVTAPRQPTNPAGRAAAPVALSADAPLDLNTATPAQLKQLPGVGEAYARRIVEGRPYLAKNQLVTRGVLPQAAYETIKELVVARRVAK